MSVLIINAMPETSREVLEVQRMLWEGGSEVVYVNYMKISHCIGCNYCWLKTPGVCTMKDDYEIILKKMLEHDRIIFITDTKFGFISYTTKALFDRMLPLATMYLKFVDGQMRHIARYNIKPQFGIIYTGDGNREYLNRWLERVAINFEGKSLGAYPIKEGKELAVCI